MRGSKIHGYRAGSTLAVILAVALAHLAPIPAAYAQEALDIGSRLELFVDDYLVDTLDNAEFKLHHPQMRGIAFELDKPWEGSACGYFTVIKDGPKYRMYYRGWAYYHPDGSAPQLTCYAESEDGIRWIKPNLELFEIDGTYANNVIWANEPSLSHNFSPFLDENPDADPAQRYKAVGGGGGGLIPLVSPDGIHWEKLRDEPVITDGAFDSQNLVFWSPSEGKYVAYYRTFRDGKRWVTRATSENFVDWTSGEDMVFKHRGQPAPAEHLYTNQTHPYYRAPHIYIALPSRFNAGVRALTDAEIHSINTPEWWRNDANDTVLMSSRGGTTYQRTFLDAFIRPESGPKDWTSRANYSVLNTVPISESEMAIYMNRHYGYPTANVTRYGLRTDGFVSINAPYEGGELVTKPLRFTGSELIINYATAAAGNVKVEVQDADGTPLDGFELGDCKPIVGDEIARVVSWEGDGNLRMHSGEPVRLRFVMKDADLYSIRFQ